MSRTPLRRRLALAVALISAGTLLAATTPAVAAAPRPATAPAVSEPANAAPEAATAVPEATTEVSGRVVDARTGAPVEGASVHASRTTAFATTGRDGAFVLTDVPGSAALVIAAKEGYAFASAPAGRSVTLKLARDTDPARSEYPRPDADRRPFTGGDWLSLNGTWSFDFDPGDVGERERWFDPRHAFGKAVRVPFGYQSLAAWGEEELATKEIFRSAFSRYRGTVWYRRTFTVPKNFSGSEVRLRIGAADWGAAVWLDGEPVLPYSGDGYTEISAGLGALAPGSSHTVTIRVVAPPTTADSPYPMGKQTGEPNGADTGWFSDVGGIWQSVWIEPYAGARLTRTRVTPELTFEGDARTPSAASARIDVAGTGTGAGTGAGTVGVTVKDPRGKVVGTAEVRLSDGEGTATIPIERPRLWEPDDPALYTADIRLGAGEGVRTTFGLRKIERAWAPGHTGEYQYVHLNNRPIYLRGVLDQGYNPWGLYTYTGVTAGPDLRTGTEADPGRGSILLDLKNAKRLGFNVIRNHLKVNEPAYYHWADRLGLMIWYDLPNAGWHSLGPEAERLFEGLLRNTFARDHNHPSIVIWTMFNESWGINEEPWQQPIPPRAFPYVRRMVQVARDLDPSRLIVDNSACCQNGHLDTDLNDFHYYLSTYDEWKKLLDGFAAQVRPGSSWNFDDGAQSGQPWLNSEFAVKSGQFPHTASLFRAYPKLNGYVGVQLAETEQEVQSPVTFDRQPNEPEFVDHRGRRRGIEMFQGDDAISLMGRSARTVDRGGEIEVPVKVSHFSDTDLSRATLRWKIGGYDAQGRWIAAAGGGSRPVAPARYTVTDAGVVTVTVPGELLTGYVWIWLDADGRTAAENTLTFDTPAPGGGFSPGAVSAQEWTGGAQAQTTGGADWVTGHGRGYFEYEAEVPKTAARSGATLIAEVASAQSRGWYDPNNVTTARRNPTRLTVSVDGSPLPAIELPDDPHGPTALAGRSRGSLTGDFGNRYGYRVAVPIPARRLGDARTVTLRFASDGGGLSIFGVRSGRHGTPPTLAGGRITVPDERPRFRAVDSRLSVYQAPAAISPETGAGTVIVSVVNDTARTARKVKVALAAPGGWTATAAEPDVIGSLKPGEARHVAFAVRAGSGVRTGQTADFTATASWSGHAVQVISTSTVTFAPDAYAEAGVDDTFDTDSSAAYQVFQPSAAEALPRLTFGGGSLRAEGPGAYYGIVAHESGPPSPRAAVIVDHGQWAGTGKGQDALFNGLIKDERNYVLAWTGIKGQHGIDIRIDGRLTNACCSSAPLEPGDRWAFVLDGNAIGIWVDRGLGWARIMSSTTQDRIDFTEPGALDGWHYAAGLRGNAGTQAITRLEGRHDPG
ncbi:glycoside hydrolase family 2 TIM barrel-domain containing protein [Nonomuraea fuscirosea]|uniref:glycoside hydrolase family 2 TIM barrel-domain containing protein n=1 Tax=Nonomuraea fuscirosea TaxID=1291556 RepID=UPI0033EC4D78